MSLCELCKNPVDEISTQEQAGFKLCMNCAYNYSNKDLIEIMIEGEEI
jgi:hypothetical protein